MLSRQSPCPSIRDRRVSACPHLRPRRTTIILKLSGRRWGHALTSGAVQTWPTPRRESMSPAARANRPPPRPPDRPSAVRPRAEIQGGEPALDGSGLIYVGVTLCRFPNNFQRCLEFDSSSRRIGRHASSIVFTLCLTVVSTSFSSVPG